MDQPKSKSTIYVATRVDENLEAKCPHCQVQVKITRRTSIIECPHCGNYMHVVFVTKKDKGPEKKKSEDVGPEPEGGQPKAQ